MIMSLKQRKMKFEPRIKLNHNTDIIKRNKGNLESIIRLKQFLTEFHFDLQNDQWSWPLQIKSFTWGQL